MKILISINEMIEAEVWGGYCRRTDRDPMMGPGNPRDEEIELTMSLARSLGLIGATCQLEYFVGKDGE